MRKLTLAGVEAEKEEVLKQLAFCGAVEVQDASSLLDGEVLPGAKMDVGNTYELRGDLERLQSAVAALTPFAPKRGMLTPKPHITREGMEDALKNRQLVTEAVDEVLRIQRLRSTLVPDRAKMEGQITSLAPWAGTNLPLGQTQTKFVSLVYGTFPAATDLAELEVRMEEGGLDCALYKASEDAVAKYVLVFCHKGCEDEVMSDLRDAAFTRLSFREFSGTPAEEIKRLEQALEENARQETLLNDQLSGMAGQMSPMQALYDALNGRLTMAEIRGKLLVTQCAFFLTGFVPETKREQLERRLQLYSVAYELTEVDAETDDPPVLLKNSKLIQPYEMVTELYSLPLYNGVDPTPLFAPFFWLFFSIMFGDIAYGLLFIGIAALALGKAKPQGFAKKLFTLVLHGGIGATAVGVITGSFFGDVITNFSSVFLSQTYALKAYFNPLENPMAMLFFSCALGIVHLLWGMAIKFYMCLKDKDYMGAFADIGLWWVVFAGIGMFAMGIQAGLSVSGAGAVGLVLTQGRAKYGLFSKLFSGILSLYNITGFLGDMLSYARLMALMLSSAVIASVFNSIGTLLGASIPGFIVFVLVFCVGHFINIFTGGLGAYVHASRLQYVEFFGKFYDSGGRAFDPYTVKTKYHTLFEEEN